MHAPLNRVGATPVINILTIPSGRIHPNIIACQLVAICCVICQLFHELSPFSCHHPLIHVYINMPYDRRTMEPLEHSSDQLIGCFYHTTTPYSAKIPAGDSKATASQPQRGPQPPRHHKTSPLSPPMR